MTEQDRLMDLEIPHTIEDALKIARSLVRWMEFIHANPNSDIEPMNSYGGHIDFHLATLNVWIVEEKIKVSAQSLKQATDELKKTIGGN